MAEKTLDLNSWIARVQKASNAKDVFGILKEFRKEQWTDDERARMAKAYIRVLERVGAPPPDETAAAAEEGEKNDGPVWYEKM